MTSGGTWTYTLDNSNGAVHALNVDDHLSDTFTVTTVDGTYPLSLHDALPIYDAAVISGTSSGTVVEAGGVSNGTPGTPTATGTLTDTDVENGTAHVSTPAT